LLPFRHIGGGSLVLLFFPSHREIGGAGDQDGRTAGGDGVALVDVSASFRA